MIDIVVDGGDQFQNIAKDAAPEALYGQIPKEALNHVEPRSTGGGEMDMKAWMPLQPALHFGMFVGGIVVHDQMERFRFRRGVIDQSQETEPLLMPVPFLA